MSYQSSLFGSSPGKTRNHCKILSLQYTSKASIAIPVIICIRSKRHFSIIKTFNITVITIKC